MAASVAWPRRGEEGIASQCWHIIQGGEDESRRRFGTQIRQEDHSIPQSVRELMRGPQISTPLIKGGKVKERLYCVSYDPTQFSVVRALPHQPKLQTIFVL